jgi:hypothetical protein
MSVKDRGGKKDKGRPYTQRRQNWRDQNFARVRAESQPDPGPPFAIHGTPVNGTNNSGSSTTVSASITTTAPDTIIVAVISNFDQLAGGTLKTVTGVSGGGLTWTKRSAQSATANVTTIINVGLEVWWAHATGTLTAQSITATFNAAPNQFCDIMLFAVTGSKSLSAPWDTNASLPATLSSSGSALTTPTKGVTVDKTGDMLLGFLAYAFNGNANSTSGTGFTDILAATTTPLRNNWEQQVTVASGAKTVNFNNDQNFMVLAVDALSGAAGTSTDGNASGAVIVVTDSIISGAATGDANVSGQVLSDTTTIIGGIASGAANANGVVIVVTDSIISGAATGAANVSGQVLSDTTTIVDGVANGAANANGAVIVVTDSIIAGSASAASDGNASGVVLSVADTIISGVATGDGNAIGDTIVVADTIIGGTETGAATAGGDTVTTTTTIVDGVATGDGNAAGAVLSETDSIVDGVATGDANANGDTIVVGVSLITPNAFVDGQILVVGITLIEGVASGPVILQGPIGGGGVHFTEPVKRPVETNALAFGVILEVKVSLLPGYATAATALEIPTPKPVDLSQFVVRTLPPPIVEVPTTVLLRKSLTTWTLQPGTASGGAIVQGTAELFVMDWTEYDNEFVLAA